MPYNQLNNKGPMKSKVFNSSVLSASFALKSCSHDFSQLSNVQFNCRADYSKAERKVLECANYLTSTPLDGSNVNRGHAETFLLLWMNGTSDFTFNISKAVGKIIESNISLLSTYIAFFAKYVILNRGKSEDEEDICKNVIILLLDYCRNHKISIVLSDLLKC